MVAGIGTDIVEIKRIEKAIMKPNFLKKCYTDIELNRLKDKKANSYAGYFCAKEAFVKALGTGFINIHLNHIEIRNDMMGKPELYLYESALKEANNRCIKNMHVSISHCIEYATAVVILEY